MTSPVSDTPTSAVPRVSVIIPFYNRESTLREAIESVLEQDYTDYELILVDDTSTDGSVAVVNAISDPRIKMVQNPGSRGESNARNVGVNLARGEWIAFQDSDDIWLPGKLSAQMNRLEGSSHIVSYCRMVVKADAGPDTPVHDRIPGPHVTHLTGDVLPGLVRDNYMSSQMLILHRETLLEVGAFDTDLFALNDWEMLLRMLQKGTADFVDDVLVVQRWTDNSVTHSEPRRVEAQEYIMRKHKDLFARYPGVLAYHANRISGGFRRLGNMTKAAQYAREAVHAGPATARMQLKALVLGVWSKVVS